WVQDRGITVVLAEHGLDRVLPYADKVVSLPGDGTASTGEPAAIMRTATVCPPVVELGKLAGWDPLPLSVRDARRRAPELRHRLPGQPPAGERGAGGAAPSPGESRPQAAPAQAAPALTAPTLTAPVLTAPVLIARGIVVRYGSLIAVRGVDLTLQGGEITALMGRNGSGKTSLLWAIQ